MIQSLFDLMHAHPWAFFCALHLTVGRIGSVSFAIAVGLNPWIYGPVAFAWECIQVPLWWWFFEAAARHTLRLRWINRWIERREDRTEHRRLWQRLGALGDTGVFLLAALPLWGCGMWTGTLLAWTIGIPLRRSFWILALGGLIGLFLIMGLGVGVKVLVT